MHFTFRAPLFRWEARRDAEWFFVALPLDASEMIREVPRPPSGFGAVRVAVEVSGVSWRTSIFPDATSGTYHLPVKRAVRRAAAAGEGDDITVELTVLDA
ncbi:hypothetical protein QE374_000624 [Microbacterium sp. SORGH_AS428]|uniref:DUF1905 domain-containing protein n=1 Tax=Microbacterium sp. SORGH_AS_0428 TaxID=3041788 RepID=UPI00285DD08B|nr:DUF1905 domain-containing protein [Microbacterium sp. SORGH_AS_0428]MDR6198715.1 hypothetical protein [Microbacterium sp. SORGH_AS_0428]